MQTGLHRKTTERRMGKNIVICCDGTGNEYGNENSNVVKLYSVLTINASQVGYYHPGVGTMGDPTAHTKLAKQWTRLKGLAIGGGLLSNVSDAYRYLMESYQAGDQVFLFGFSRGAYTVRVLGGLLHMFGLLCPGNDGLIPYVTRLFAQRSRDAKGDKRTLELAQGFKDTFSRDCPIRFVGVWDTVDSIGWLWDPVVLPFSGQNPLIQTGRQALAIDERRSFYEPKIWGSPVINTSTGQLQDIEQLWFSGVHSDVGGSYPLEESGPSQIALRWMLGEACQAGLQVNVLKIPRVLEQLEDGTSSKLHKSLRGLWWLLEMVPRRDDREHRGFGGWRFPDFGKRRYIPEKSHVHESVIQRMKIDRDYRPPNLVKSSSIDPGL